MRRTPSLAGRQCLANLECELWKANLAVLNRYVISFIEADRASMETKTAQVGPVLRWYRKSHSRDVYGDIAQVRCGHRRRA